jgi:hypothetical protein
MPKLDGHFLNFEDRYLDIVNQITVLKTENIQIYSDLKMMELEREKDRAIIKDLDK